MEESLKIETDAFVLEAGFDAAEKLHALRFQSVRGEYRQALKALKEAALEMSAPQILALAAGDILSGSLPFERTLYALKILVKRFQGSDVYAAQTRGADPSRLVCRCLYMDRKALEEAFRSAKGDYKQALLECNASMICSSCSADVKEVYEGMSFEELERRAEQIRDSVGRSLEDFAMVSPPLFEKMRFEAVSAKKETVKIKVSGDRQGVSRGEIKTVLENYLKDQLEGFKVSVFF